MNRPQKSQYRLDWLTESVGVGGIHFIGLFDVKFNDTHFFRLHVDAHAHKKHLNCFVIEFPNAMSKCHLLHSVLRNMVQSQIECFFAMHVAKSRFMRIVTVIVIIYQEKLIHPCHSIFFLWEANYDFLSPSAI